MRRPVLTSWLSFGNRKTKKHIGTPERANFEFRRLSGEDFVSNHENLYSQRGNSRIFVKAVFSNMKTIIRTILNWNSVLHSDT